MGAGGRKYKFFEGYCLSAPSFSKVNDESHSALIKKKKKRSRQHLRSYYRNRIISIISTEECTTTGPGFSPCRACNSTGKCTTSRVLLCHMSCNDSMIFWHIAYTRTRRLSMRQIPF